MVSPYTLFMRHTAWGIFAQIAAKIQVMVLLTIVARRVLNRCAANVLSVATTAVRLHALHTWESECMTARSCAASASRNEQASGLF